MSLAIGESVRFDRYRETIKRGDDYRFEFAIRLNPGGDCGPLINGAAFDGRGYTATSRARVAGTNALIASSTLITTSGNATDPMRIFVRVAKENIAAVFAAGAFEEFEIQVQVERPQETTTVLDGRVTVEDTASGARL